MNNKDIENRLISFSINVSELVCNLPGHPILFNLRDQIIRSSTSVTLNYGEAQSASSKKDFIFKITIVLKELRETQLNLKMINKLELFPRNNEIDDLLNENDQLLAIFYRTLQTAKMNLYKNQKK